MPPGWTPSPQVIQFDSMFAGLGELPIDEVIVTLWLVTAGMLALVWLVRFVAISRIVRRHVLLTSRSYDAAPNPPPKLSVLVAARDEEANIERCINSLLAQDYPNYEIVAIDDRSHDRTAPILQHLAARSGGRLHVVTVKELPNGWFGKNNAMREGVEAATGEWLLFTDADCCFDSPRTLSMAMREAAEHRLDFLSIIPVLETPTPWERIIQPVCSLVLILWFLPERVNDPQKKTAYANGAFMLMKRRCYGAIGGHEAVRAELNEDIKMARLAKRAGFALRVIENDDLYRSRMYSTPREAWRGWSRIYFGSLNTFRRLIISLGMITCYSLYPWISLVAAIIGWTWADASRADTWATAIGAWLAVVLLMQMTMWRFYGMVRVGRGWSLGYILGALAATGMLVTALLKALGITGTTWRGTHYRPKDHQLRAASAKRVVRASEVAGVASAARTEPRPHGRASLLASRHQYRDRETEPRP